MLLVAYIPTGMHLAKMVPIYAIIHSGVLKPMRLTTVNSGYFNAKSTFANLRHYV